MGGAAHAHVIGSTCESASPPACHRVNAQGVRPTCESAGPRARRGTKAASTPRQTAPLKLSAHTWSSFAHTPGIWGYSYSHDETTTFNVDFPAPASRKVATKPTRFVRPSSWLPPTSIPIFPHQQSEKSPQNQHVLSYNPNTTTGTARTRPGIQKTDIRDRMSACGGARGIRTPDLLIANETRYQLRHSPKDSNSLAPWRSATQADHDHVRDTTDRKKRSDSPVYATPLPNTTPRRYPTLRNTHEAR